MAHDLKTRTIDYTMDQPPEWATPDERIKFWPKRTAKLISIEVERVEAEMAAKKAAKVESEVANE